MKQNIEAEDYGVSSRATIAHVVAPRDPRLNQTKLFKADLKVNESIRVLDPI